MKERKARMKTMIQTEEIRSAVANLQIDSFQIRTLFRQLEERFEILELKLDEVLETMGKK